MANVINAVNRHLRQQHDERQRSGDVSRSRHLDPAGGGDSPPQVAQYGPDYGRELVRSPEPSDEEKSTSSGESMVPHGDQWTPADSPPEGGSPTAEVGLHRLSLEHNHHSQSRTSTQRGRGLKATAPSKRAASSDLPRDSGKQRPAEKAKRNGRTAGAASRGTHTQKGRTRNSYGDHKGFPIVQPGGLPRPTTDAPASPVTMEPSHQACNDPMTASHPQAYTRPTWHDSGYESRKNTINTTQAIATPASTPASTPAVARSKPKTVYPAAPILQTINSQRGILTLPQKARWPGMILQPDSCPISEDQLTAEIKAIYAGLVVVEAKCINVDAAQACDTSTDIDQGRWQGMIGLHRTLLYEHHDFLMATQHPSATPALRALPSKYSMPARMWKHGIHGFLEVLRHRRPQLQDYMVSFIYLAYQMMALLYETVPTFLDTWIECLGDLARYRMAIEEEREEHAQWAGVAASWYIKASDRHPQIGRLYHHLAILERPSLRKFACYGKSLTCVVPFPNARESLYTLCGPIADEPQPARPIALQTEAAFCKLHAVIFLARPDSTIHVALNHALSMLQHPDAFKWRDCGVPLAVANISALLGHGAATNPLRHAFDRTIRNAIQRSRPSPVDGASKKFNNLPTLSGEELEESRRLLEISRTLTLDSFHTCLRWLTGTPFFKDTFAFVGVMLCFLHFFALTKKDAEDDPDSEMALGLVFGLDDVAWVDLATYLNQITQLYPVTPHIVRAAQQGTWPEKVGEARPLPEDYSIRGLVWSYFAFCQGWFDSDEDQDFVRTVETASTHKARGDRASYFGLRIAFETEYLIYDPTSRTFAAGVSAGNGSTHSLRSVSTGGVDTLSQRANAASAATWSPTTSARASSGSDSDFVHVRRPAPQAAQPQPQPQRLTATAAPAPAKTWAAVAKAPRPAAPPSRPRKQRVDGRNVRVVDPDRIEWNAEE